MPPTDLASEVVDLASDDTPGLRPAKRLRSVHGGLRAGVVDAAQGPIVSGTHTHKTLLEHRPINLIACTSHLAAHCMPVCIWKAVSV